MEKPLGALGVPPSVMWLQRVWQEVPGLLRAAAADALAAAAAAASRIDVERVGSAATAAAAASTTANDCVRMLSAVALLVFLGVKLPDRDSMRF